MNFRKLDQLQNSYSINYGKKFNGLKIDDDFISSVFEFSYNMTFGKIGAHRTHRSGGQFSRKNGELFANTFQGKLSEFAIYSYLTSKGYNLELPLLEMWELGKWDESDFEINNTKISIKSASFFSNLLLLETRDWDNSGRYIPNDIVYDIHILVRIKPDVKGLMRANRLFFSDEVDEHLLRSIIFKEEFEFDIPGFLTKFDIQELIQNRLIIPQNTMLNGKTRMDAENYYCQSGNLRDISSLVI